jgi:hypothetical protein
MTVPPLLILNLRHQKQALVTADGINVLIRHDQKSLLGKLLLVYQFDKKKAEICLA